MKSKSWKSPEPPTLEQLEAELGREKCKRRYKRVLRSTVYTLVVVAAVAVLVATIWMPVLQIYGSSMTPTLNEGDIVLSVKGSGFEPGDLVAFYLGNKILVKRCIAGPGQWVDIDENGNVSVDGRLLEEPYLTEKALGECDITLPIRCRITGISVWGITVPLPWIPGTRKLGVYRKNKSLGKSYFVSGHYLALECCNKREGREHETRCIS